MMPRLIRVFTGHIFHFEGFVLQLFKLLGSNVRVLLEKGKLYDLNQCIITRLPIYPPQRLSLGIEHRVKHLTRFERGAVAQLVDC